MRDQMIGKQKNYREQAKLHRSGIFEIIEHVIDFFQMK